MCGITGFNWEDKELIRGMSSLIQHRGPDGEGVYTDDNISLGHRRLSIIDLSSAGSQPMCNEEGNLWLTYNGEIYNFLELRELLEKKGHKFKSNTDTEVIIHAYEEWGNNCLQRFNGMFAFAIWDSKKNKLFLARDRLGIKPLYYYWNGDKFIFASEIKSILLHDINREVNKTAAKNYFNLRYIPGEETLFQGIKKLLPGHTLTLHNKEIHLDQFWNFPLPEPKKDERAIKKTRDLFVTDQCIVVIWMALLLEKYNERCCHTFGGEMESCVSLQAKEVTSINKFV